AYAFVSVVMFGAFYYMLPHLTGKRWPWPRMIAAHYWLTVAGFAIYFLSLSIGGWLQGIALLDATTSFADITRDIRPYLEGRSLGGGLMTLGHLIFGAHVIALFCAKRQGAA
ncbi:cbb3-type cytochrome c oxidase subunit I, partial [Bordetella pseudohinzii]